MTLMKGDFMDTKLTPRRAVVLSKSTPKTDSPITVCVAKWDKEVEAVNAALKGKQVLMEYIASHECLYATLNHSAMVLLEQCDGVTTIEEIKRLIQKRYQVGADEAAEFVTEGLQSLNAEGLIKLDWSPL